MSNRDEPGRLASIRLIESSRPSIRARAVHHRLWTGLALLLFYALLALVMLSPLAPEALPESPAQDLANHVSGIIEARNALVEGQFPIRVAPNQNNRERYPVFQFHGNLPYTLGGLLYLATDLNPYTIWKLVVFISLVIGALFTYQCALFMTRRRMPAMTAGAVFLTAPYLLVDIHSRFAYPEVVSFALLPCVFFYTMRSFISRNPVYIFFGAIAWNCLELSHNITFFYASLFFGFYLLTFARITTKYVGRMFRVGVSYAGGVLLSAWYIVPQLFLLPSLAINLSPSVQSPYRVAWLTPLYVLLAPTLVPPTPPDPAILLPPRFGLQIGWPILIAFGLVCFYRYRSVKLSLYHRNIILRLLCFFVISFFMIWSPVDFWRYLPKSFNYIQFSYRLLMFIVLWGSLLTVYALICTFRRGVSAKHTIPVIAVLVLFTISYLGPHAPASQTSLESEISTPNMGRGGAGYAYMLSPRVIVTGSLFHRDVNLADWDHHIVNVQHQLLYPGMSVIPAPLAGDELIIGGRVPDEYRAPVRLTILLDNKQIANELLEPGVFKLTLPITTTFTRERAYMSMQTDRYLHPVQKVPVAPEPGMLALEINEIRLRGSPERAKDGPLLPVAEVRKTMSPGRPATYIIHTSQATLVQLPVLFYPDMLEIRDNGNLIAYDNIGRSTAIHLPPGDHTITADFVGVQWANILSSLTWICVFLAFIFINIRHHFNIKPK
jgi:hypothetical protein